MMEDLGAISVYVIAAGCIITAIGIIIWNRIGR